MSTAVCWLVASSCVLTAVLARLSSLSTVDEYLNICMDGKNHKFKPGPENKLLGEYCSPWANRSCCTPQTAEGLHTSPKWLNFGWDHCRELSPQCRQYFLMDLCFYECSPNVGPWLVEDPRKIRKERFLNVPLCQQECKNWWAACKDDFTCVKDWSKEFNWTSGTNTCPGDKSCINFSRMYKDSTDFCQSVMGGSFKVVPDEQDCFYLWFDPHYPNPNEKVARKKASQLLGVAFEEPDTSSGSASGLFHYHFLFVLFGILLRFALFFRNI